MRTVAIVLLAVTSVVSGYPTGAPTGRCESMQPGHGSASTAANPHSFSVSSTSYTAGGTVEVTISGTIKGLLLQARKADGSSTTPYGSFTVDTNDAVKLLECSSEGDSVTHSATDDKTNLKVTWKAPDSDVGEINFIATVNEAKDTYWMNMKSVALTYSEGSSTSEVSATMLLVVSAATLCLLKHLLRY